jgi:hypothetical protein
LPQGQGLPKRGDSPVGNGAKALTGGHQPFISIRALVERARSGPVVQAPPFEEPARTKNSQNKPTGTARFADRKSRQN